MARGEKQSVVERSVVDSANPNAHRMTIGRLLDVKARPTGVQIEADTADALQLANALRTIQPDLDNFAGQKVKEANEEARRAGEAVAMRGGDGDALTGHGSRGYNSYKGFMAGEQSAEAYEGAYATASKGIDFNEAQFRKEWWSVNAPTDALMENEFFRAKFDNAFMTSVAKVQRLAENERTTKQIIDNRNTLHDTSLATIKDAMRPNDDGSSGYFGLTQLNALTTDLVNTADGGFTREAIDEMTYQAALQHASTTGDITVLDVFTQRKMDGTPAWSDKFQRDANGNPSKVRNGARLEADKTAVITASLAADARARTSTDLANEDTANKAFIAVMMTGGDPKKLTMLLMEQGTITNPKDANAYISQAKEFMGNPETTSQADTATTLMTEIHQGNYPSDTALNNLTQSGKIHVEGANKVYALRNQIRKAAIAASTAANKAEMDSGNISYNLGKAALRDSFVKLTSTGPFGNITGDEAKLKVIYETIENEALFLYYIETKGGGLSHDAQSKLVSRLILATQERKAQARRASKIPSLKEDTGTDTGIGSKYIK